MDESGLDVTVTTSAPLDSFDGELLSRLNDLEEKKWHSQPYNKSVSQINWEQVAFDDHSAEECKAQWEKIESRLRLKRTLPELLTDARAFHWDPVRMRKAQRMKLRAEGAPVKPLTTYMLFLADMRPKIMEKHPDITVGGIARIASEKFRALSEKKKAMYKARSAAGMEEYHAKMSAFSKEHPDATTGPPQKPRSPVWYYRQKHPELSVKQARAAMAAMSAEERFRYIRRAQRALHRYEKAVEAYQVLYPDWRPSKSPRVLSKADQGALDEAEGKVPPPRRPYDIFRKSLATSHGQEVGRQWRALNASDRAQYQRMADQEKQRYEAYLATLPAEIRQQMSKPTVTKMSKPRVTKKITGKQLYVQEKMPKVFDGGLSEDEWRRALISKFNKLSSSDKEMYQRRAEELNEDALAGKSRGATSADSDTAPPLAANPPPQTNGTADGENKRGLSTDSELGAESQRDLLSDIDRGGRSKRGLSVDRDRGGKKKRDLSADSDTDGETNFGLSSDLDGGSQNKRDLSSDSDTDGESKRDLSSDRDGGGDNKRGLSAARDKGGKNKRDPSAARDKGGKNKRVLPSDMDGGGDSKRGLSADMDGGGRNKRGPSAARDKGGKNKRGLSVNREKGGENKRVLPSDIDEGGEEADEDGYRYRDEVDWRARQEGNRGAHKMEEEDWDAHQEENNGLGLPEAKEPVGASLTAQTEQEPEPATPKKKKRKKAEREESEVTSTPVQTAPSDEPPRTPLDLFTALYIKKSDQGASVKKRRKEAKKLWKGLDEQSRTRIEAKFQTKYGNSE